MMKYLFLAFLLTSCKSVRNAPDYVECNGFVMSDVTFFMTDRDNTRIDFKHGKVIILSSGTPCMAIWN